MKDIISANKKSLEVLTFCLGKNIFTMDHKKLRLFSINQRPNLKAS